MTQVRFAAVQEEGSDSIRNLGSPAAHRCCLARVVGKSLQAY